MAQGLSRVEPEPVPYSTTTGGHTQSASALPATLYGLQTSANARWVHRQPATLKHPLSVAGKAQP